MDILINANEDISEDDVEIIDAKKHAAREAMRLAKELANVNANATIAQ